MYKPAIPISAILLCILLTSCFPSGRILKSEEFDYKLLDTVLLFHPKAVTIIYEDGKSDNDIALDHGVESNLLLGIKEFVTVPMKYCILEEEKQKAIDKALIISMFAIKKRKTYKEMTIPSEVDMAMRQYDAHYAVGFASIGFTHIKDPSPGDSRLGVASAMSEIYCIIFDRKRNGVIYFGNDIDNMAEPALKEISDEQIKNLVKGVLDRK